MSELLTPKVISILSAMQSNIQKWYYTRELAKFAKVSTWAVSQQFSKLVDEGMVLQRAEGREKYYRLNLANSKTRKLCELFETEKKEEFLKKNRKLAWILEDFKKRISDFVPEVHSIILFGSVARGEATIKSDVDVLVLVSNSEEGKFKEVMGSVDRLANEVSGRYPKKLVPLMMMMKDFEKSLKEQKRFAVDVQEDGIVLSGQEAYYLMLSRVI
jgi:predicted nucleotidyltransferase